MNFNIGNPSESLKYAYQQFCREDAEERERDRKFLAKLQKFESKTVELSTHTQLARQMKNQYEKIVMQQNPLLWAKVQQNIAKLSPFRVDKLIGTKTKDVAINTYQDISSASDQDSLHEGIWPHSPSPDPEIKENEETPANPVDLKQLSQKPCHEQQSLKLTTRGHFSKEYPLHHSEGEHLNQQHSQKLTKETHLKDDLSPIDKGDYLNKQFPSKVNKGENFNEHPSPKPTEEDRSNKLLSPPASFKFSPQCVSSPYATKQAEKSTTPITYKNPAENDNSIPELANGKPQAIETTSVPKETQGKIQPPAVSVLATPVVESKTFRLDSDSESADVISGPKNGGHAADEDSDSFWS